MDFFIDFLTHAGAVASGMYAHSVLLKNGKKNAEYSCLCGRVCGNPFMRYRVRSFWRWILNKPHSALICPKSKEIVGWERVPFGIDIGGYQPAPPERPKTPPPRSP